jgi:CubicO group peptidase (beta-lactamase class C family)
MADLMKYTKIMLRCAVVLVLAVTCTAQNKTNETRPSQPDLARMQQIIQSQVEAKKFMGTVLVERDGKLLLDQGYGYANLEWNIPNSPTAKFRLGSVTKQFTAASILLLEERGKLNINDPVKKYMPNAPAAWDKVTIYNLLTHTSGIPSFTSFPDYTSTEAKASTPEELIARFRDKPLNFQPGEKWEYSNSGYVLLGYLLEKISGQKYADFVQRNIFTPVGMKDSGYDSNSAIIPHRASGYSPSSDGVVNSGYIDMSIPFSAGALYSTTEDLMGWEEALFGGKVLSAGELQKMITPFKNDYAFGLGVREEHGHKLIDHGGGIEGFNTYLSYYPDEKLAVIVLANLNGTGPNEIAHNLAAVLHGEKVVLPSERKEITVASAVLAKYVGIYQLAPTFSITVTLEGNQLITQATGQGKVPIFPESETMFFAKVVDAEIEFVQNEKGEATAMILHQGGQDIKGERKQ